MDPAVRNRSNEGHEVGLRRLELGIIGALAYWEYQTGKSAIARFLLSIAAPLIGFGFWGLVDFRGAGSMAEALRLIQELVISGLAAVALYVAGQESLGWALAAISIVHHAMVYLLGERLLKEERPDGLKMVNYGVLSA